VRFVFDLDLSGVDVRVVEASLRILESRFRGPLSKELISKYYTRALRGRIWWRLPVEVRGLIYAALHSSVKVFRGSRVVAALSRALAYIDLYSMRGLVVLLGLTYALPRHLLSLGEALLKANYIAYLGRRLLESYTYLYPYLKHVYSILWRAG